MAALQLLPQEVLRSILLFVDHPASLLGLERTCKALREAVGNDAVWESLCRNGRLFRRRSTFVEDHRFMQDVPDCGPKIETYRERACIGNAISNIKKAQTSTESAIGSIMSVEAWKALVTCILDVYLPDDLVDAHNYKLRGDTSSVLMELVEGGLIAQFQSANLIACAMANETKVYPYVTRMAFELQDAVASRGKSRLVTGDMLDDDSPFDLWPGGKMEQIIRRIAYKAGVVKMSNDVYDLAWKALIQLIVLLMRPACIELAGSTGNSLADKIEKGSKALLSPYETMREISPLSTFDVCSCCDGRFWTHTPVPRQLEDAARALSIPCKVYGNEWHTTPQGSDDPEAAQAAYSDEEAEEPSNIQVECDNDSISSSASHADNSSEEGEEDGDDDGVETEAPAAALGESHSVNEAGPNGGNSEIFLDSDSVSTSELNAVEEEKEECIGDSSSHSVVVGKEDQAGSDEAAAESRSEFGTENVNPAKRRKINDGGSPDGPASCAIS